MVPATLFVEKKINKEIVEECFKEHGKEVKVPNRPFISRDLDQIRYLGDVLNKQV